MITAIIANQLERCVVVGSRSIVSTCGVSSADRSFSYRHDLTRRQPCRTSSSFHFNLTNYQHSKHSRSLNRRLCGSQGIQSLHLPTRHLHTNKNVYAQPQQDQSNKVTSNQSTDNSKPTESFWARMKAAGKREAAHYRRGTQLLWVDLKISYDLWSRSRKGEQLMRREEKQLCRTKADLLKLIPFSILVALPMSMFSIPVLLKMFPNMLPSTYAEEKHEVKSRLNIYQNKYSSAKLLQDSIARAVAARKVNDSQNAELVSFQEMSQRTRSAGSLASVEDIAKFGQVAESALAFKSLSDEEVEACCKLFEVSTTAASKKSVRGRLHRHLDQLIADDALLKKEGLADLTVWELRDACRERGMRSLDVSADRLRKQLHDWLRLRTFHKAPSSLVIFSRPMYMPETVPAEDRQVGEISFLPTIESVQALVRACRDSKRESQVDKPLRKQQKL